MTDETNHWGPVCGDTTRALGEYLVREGELPEPAAFERIVEESVRLLGNCGPFQGEDQVTTGLVLGYVQSGKTMSMTTVASLARDNGCRLVVLLAGTTTNLLKQTARERVRPYLLNRPDQRRGWILIDTVESRDLSSYSSILRDRIRDWLSSDVPERRKRPVFITVMKNHSHLKQLSQLLNGLPMKGVPCLVLDDEADQAGLDTNASKRAAGQSSLEASTTHQRIAAIRAELPHHTYLQYTATPQAPLLISLTDMLSPDFAHVLTPGAGYTGGRAFFVENPRLVVELPPGDLFNPNSPPSTPPDSLQHAMQDFLIGAAVVAVRNSGGVRSMLVHPSQRKDDHQTFLRFVNNLLTSWKDQLRLPQTDPSHVALMEDLGSAYERVAGSGLSDIPPFEDLRDELRWVLKDVRVWRVNSEDGREVDWGAAPSHILVGGDKLNRGYTVKGLTVTYMPRNPGGWNSDTIQQRARFFGYKQSYLGLCRLYLHPDIADAYREYVEHEEDIRTQLRDHRGPLNKWKRAFLLNHRLRPTRSNVLSTDVLKPKVGEWFRQNYPHATPEAIRNNRQTIDQFLNSLNFRQSTKNERHQEADTPLEALLRHLVDYQCFGPDSVKWTGLWGWISGLVASRPGTECQVIYIQGGRQRERQEDTKHIRRINQLFEGRTDTSMRDNARVTLQIHRLNIRGADTTYEDVPAIAIRMPDGFQAADVQVQIQPIKS
ncbi:MAG: Z1 domain-containing protein [Myxococcota bacterium]